MLQIEMLQIEMLHIEILHFDVLHLMYGILCCMAGPILNGS